MKKALVAGALGVTGRALVNHLVSLGDWEVIGLSRRKPEFQTAAQYVSVDLLRRSEVEARLSEIGDVTHVFYAALQPAADFFAEIAPNLAMLAHTVETVERFSKSFRKIVLLEGAKFYGAHRAHAAELLLQPRRLFAGTFERKSLVLVGLETVEHLWFCGGESDEYGHRHRGVCDPL